MTGLYFEEFFVGQKVTTVGRTITEFDIATFAGLSGDYNQIHTDAEFSKNTPIGQRIAHGILGLSIASGLAMRTGIGLGRSRPGRGPDEPILPTPAGP